MSATPPAFPPPSPPETDVPAKTWCLSPAVAPERRRRLVDEPLPSGELLQRVAAAALAEAKAGAVDVSWVRAEQAPPPGPAFFRFEATVRLTAALLDMLFHGRTGYRAAYWVSLDHGMAFNAAALRKLEPAMSVACAGLAQPWPLVRRSLLGEHSKIWLSGESVFAQCKERLLCPPRWRDKPGVGTCIPLPQPPAMDIKGTFVNPESSEVWLDPLKLNRHHDLHHTGHT